MSMKTFKVGDTVKFRHHSEAEKNHYPISWTPIMRQCEGCHCRVVEIPPARYRERLYIVEYGGKECLVLGSSLSDVTYDIF